jgi:hypothetical protein
MPIMCKRGHKLFGIRMTHYPDDFDVNSSVIEPLRQGRIYEV